MRVTVQALAAVLGGCQSLHTNSMDEALSLPSEAAVRTALRTQQILAHESGVADERRSPRRGVPGRAPHAGHRGRRDGLPRQDRRARRRGGGDSLHAARDPGRGVSLPAGGREPRADRRGRQRVRERRAAAGRRSSSPSPEVESRQAERLRDLRRRRDGDRAARALDAIERAARGTDNLVPRLLDAVQADVTLGEIGAAPARGLRRSPPVGGILTPCGA